MAYNTKPIVTDVDGNPISQYYNPDTDSYEPVEGQAGANKVVLYNADGTENNSLSLQPILDKLSQLTGTVIDEETRKSNEIIRQDNEQLRVQLYNDLMAQLDRIEQIQEQVPETVLEAINALRDELGNLEDLETIDKSSIINAINEINQALLTHQQNTNQEIGQVASDLAAHKAESASKHIKESGNNTNGRYIKFDDGTMICYGNSGVKMTEWNWTYPAMFISTPIVIALPAFSTTEQINTQITLYTHDKRSTLCEIKSYETSVYMQAIAIGRWK